MTALLWLILVLCLVGVGIFIGLVLAEAPTEDDRKILAQQEARVRADMDALTRAQQLNTAFLAARGAMWDEARQHRSSGLR